MDNRIFTNTQKLQVMQLIMKTVKTWRVDLNAEDQVITNAKIRREVFLSDLLSLLLIVEAILLLVK